ncbi:MAG: DUF1957 domain-containing protein [Deltaproteobacteria bacterium]|nr:DUF1957 domain-containing protein [Deltaproteobacteria bacterium]
MQKKIFGNDQVKLVQKIGPYVEVYFDWEKLPALDLSIEYYLVEILPESDIIPVEYARPNSSGPLYFCLKENVGYHFKLLRVPHLVYRVESNLKPLPHVDLIKEHEALQKLTWGNVDIASLAPEAGEDFLEIWVDGELSGKQHKYQSAYYEITKRPKKIKVRLGKELSLFEVVTNFDQSRTEISFSFQLKGSELRMYLSTAITPEENWKIRAEIPARFKMREIWREEYQKKFPKESNPKLIGYLRWFEDEKHIGEARLFGYWCVVLREYIEKIQLEEWGLEKLRKVSGLKLQLQITSAHRELYKFPLYEKEFNNNPTQKLFGFDEEEIRIAERNLFKKNPHVAWDTSFIELVLWFQSDGYSWQEFQRETAHLGSWMITPGPATELIRAQWVLKDMETPGQQLKFLETGIVKRDHFSAKIHLKPFSAVQIVACWDLEVKAVTDYLWSEWKVGMEGVGFYIKLHEEYLGKRLYRADLDCHVIDLFSAHQNRYIHVEPNKCYSAEIVVRMGHKELALTAVSKSIVVPRLSSDNQLPNPPRMAVGHSWYHTSQREVAHQHGKDSSNIAKVLLHLHMHSPNLLRVDPFREGFLRNSTWPFKTGSGAEVHNPPGEWALKNCLDSWLPILRACITLKNQGIDYQLSLDISPPVAYLISSPRFKDYMSRFLLRMIARIKSQLALMKSRLDSPDLIWAGQRYLEDLEAIDRFYNHDLQKNMIGAFRELELQGFLEISTCTATHGMPAVLESTPDSLKTQVALACRSHHRIFGDRPRGIWPAENSFFPGMEHFLDQESLYYFFTEAEAVLWGSHQLAQEEFNPLLLPDGGIVAFGRSRMGRLQVWDADHGYAGHPDFREYHHRHLGLPLKKITSKLTEDKAPYNPDHAEHTAKSFAHDFHNKLSQKANELRDFEFPNIPLITCTYDAELFGHHWSEGVIFLEELLRAFYHKSDFIGLTTPSHYLVGKPVLPTLTPNPSTWGHEAVHIRWTDAKVIWTQRQLDRADELLRKYLEKAVIGVLNETQKRMVEQMGAELVRAQSSDLTFVIMAGDFEEDMVREIQKYLDYFYRLKYLVDNRIEDEDFLEFRLLENDMFPEIPEYYQIRSSF